MLTIREREIEGLPRQVGQLTVLERPADLSDERVSERQGGGQARSQTPSAVARNLCNQTSSKEFLSVDSRHGELFSRRI